jgi:hypothetical protein
VGFGKKEHKMTSLSRGLRIYRAYMAAALSNNSQRTELMIAIVRHWLANGEYILTAGPADPPATPTNVVALSKADIYARARMKTHAPLYLWHYPLECQLQLWRGGWDVKVAAEIVTEDPSFRRQSQFNRLRSLLQDLIESTNPLLVIGPTAVAPGETSHALRLYESWDLFYLGPTLYNRFHWKTALQQQAVKRKLRDLNGGLWVERAKASPETYPF